MLFNVHLLCFIPFLQASLRDISNYEQEAARTHGKNVDRRGGGSGGRNGDFSQIKDIREQLLNAANEKVCHILQFVYFGI